MAKAVRSPLAQQFHLRGQWQWWAEFDACSVGIYAQYQCTFVQAENGCSTVSIQNMKINPLKIPHLLFTFKEGVLRFLKSQEMCFQFGCDTASGISREQFQVLVGDALVGWTGGYQLLSWTDVQYFPRASKSQLFLIGAKCISISGRFAGK